MSDEINWLEYIVLIGLLSWGNNKILFYCNLWYLRHWVIVWLHIKVNISTNASSIFTITICGYVNCFISFNSSLFRVHYSKQLQDSEGVGSGLWENLQIIQIFLLRAANCRWGLSSLESNEWRDGCCRNEWEPNTGQVNIKRQKWRYENCQFMNSKFLGVWMNAHYNSAMTIGDINAALFTGTDYSSLLLLGK